MKSKETADRSRKRSNAIAERRKKEDRRNKKRRAHPRVALVPTRTERRSEERRATE